MGKKPLPKLNENELTDINRRAIAIATAHFTEPDASLSSDLPSYKQKQRQRQQLSPAFRHLSVLAHSKLNNKVSANPAEFFDQLGVQESTVQEILRLTGVEEPTPPASNG